MKILFCTDGSDTSFAAAEKSLSFLKKDNRLDILYVLDKEYPAKILNKSKLAGQKSIIYKNYSRSILEKAAQYLENKGYTVTNMLDLEGNPADKIIQFVKTGNYDLCILGSHGKSGITSWLGSVSRKVIANSSIPVLVVRPKDSVNNVKYKKSKNILVAIDGSDTSYFAIHKMIELLNIKDDDIEIIDVVDSSETIPSKLVLDDEWLDTYMKMQRASANEVLDKAMDIFKQNNIQPKSAFIVEGNPAKEILDYSKENRIDLTVIGSKGHGEIANLLMGSVSRRILDNIGGVVLVVPKKNFEASAT